ncbi:hypothetical protein [Falsiroseomonas tokyonensis]|uniref:Uncharacterized protein n=1 Tax=Falsiroseomonas tokyonensis TaxID=430521 RepID=A0ABV7BY47_9PROT|nr:hypothetical protein [Falsiroseomonas tokyonensis]MBU8540189.1 hypothetical protein [Falsiroseomonas tokyonensis]
MVTLAARAITLLGVPVMLASIYWAADRINDLGQRMRVIEAQRQQGRAEIIQRIERLEQSDTRDQAKLDAMQRELAALASTAAAILREIETLRREAILREQRTARP